MRVLHVFGRMDRGGAEMRTLDLMPLMLEEGIHFDFCTLRAGEGQLDEKIRSLGGNVIQCPLTRNRIAFFSKFKAILRANNYDVVHSHVHLFSGAVLRSAKQAGVAGRVIHFRNTNDGKGQSIFRRIYRKIMRSMASKNANAVLAVCTAAMEQGWGTDWEEDDRAKVIYNGLNLNNFKENRPYRSDLEAELGLPENCEIVVQVGRFSGAKGHRDVIELLPRLFAKRPDLHIIFVGDGIYRNQVSQRVSELGISAQVHFLGIRDDVPQILRACDCSILPSHWEGLPGVVLESIAAGTPVVATGLPGVREIAAHTPMVHPVTGGLSDSFTDEIDRVLDSPDLPASSAFPRIFGIKHCAHQVRAAYQQAVSSDK